MPCSVRTSTTSVSHVADRTGSSGWRFLIVSTACGSETWLESAALPEAAGLSERRISVWCGRSVPLRVMTSSPRLAAANSQRRTRAIARRVREGGLGRGVTVGSMAVLIGAG